MIGWMSRRRKIQAEGYRQNRWKGLRAGQVDEMRRLARQSHVVATCCLFVRVAVWVAGLTTVTWGGIAASREIVPVIQRGLEIRDVQIEGLRHVTKQEVVNRLALKKGLALHEVNLSYLAERLRTISWIKETTVERLPLHVLRITVVERKPAAVAKVGSEHFLLDEDAVVLTRLGGQDEPTLPLLGGIDLSGLLQDEMRQRRTMQSSIELARAMAQTVEGRVEMDLSNPANLVASAKGVRFQFGDGALLEQWNRFRMVKALFKSALFEGKKREGGEVDLRYDNRVIVRERW